MNIRKLRQKGNAMVEFSLAAAILVPCFVGVFEFGYGFYTYNVLIAGVRAGARYASLAKYDSATATPTTSFQNAVKNTVVYGSPTGGTQTLVPGLTTSNVTVTVQMVNNVPDMVNVSINNFSVNTVFRRLQWTNKPSASFRYEGTFAPTGGS
jgi:Flp pilus assembly protein TadG